MARRYSLLLALLALGCATRRTGDPVTPPPASLEPALMTYLNAALDTLRRVSRHSSVDFDQLRDSMVALGLGARQPRDLYPVIDWMLGKVDRHSFLQAARFGARDADLGDQIAYIRVPFWSNTTMVPTLSDTLQGYIRRNEAAGACRWVVDLRANGGGNMWPMLAGIGPLLGDTIVGGTTSPRGKAYWTYSAGAASLVHEDGRVETLITATMPVTLRDPLPAVAVLIDAGTGSSGEVMAVSFRGRPRTRFFGVPTAGVSTTNQGFRLPDGANMVITVGTYVDRTSAEYGRPVPPDVIVRSPLNGPSMLLGDPTVAAARDWLRTQSCPP
jgi:C-terminal processing protease CtpA/Prc